MTTDNYTPGGAIPALADPELSGEFAALLARCQAAWSLFDVTLTAIPQWAWERPSACDGWSLADVVGHCVWGQRLVTHAATDQPYPIGGGVCSTGAPGTAHPAALLDGDPVAAWRTARAGTINVLTVATLRRPMDTPVGRMPVADFLSGLPADLIAHSWDLAHPLGLEVRVDEALAESSLAWARGRVSRSPAARSPAGIGLELTPPPGADPLTRFLAFVGRRNWPEAAERV